MGCGGNNFNDFPENQLNSFVQNACSGWVICLSGWVFAHLVHMKKLLWRRRNGTHSSTNVSHLSHVHSTCLQMYSVFYFCCVQTSTAGVALKVQSHTHHNHFAALFPGPPRSAGARRKLLDFMVQGKINTGGYADHPAGRNSIRTNQCPTLPSPHIFYMPDALRAAQPTASKHWRQRVTLVRWGKFSSSRYDTSLFKLQANFYKLECGRMPNVMAQAALSNIGGALCSTTQSFADAQY